MSQGMNGQTERLQATTEQLRKELSIERSKVSVAGNDLKQYCLNTPDPLVSGVPKRDNPFLKQGSCTIL